MGSKACRAEGILLAGLSGGGKRFGPPPESGPVPQGGGLSTMFNRVKPLVGVIYGRYRKRTPEYKD